MMGNEFIFNWDMSDETMKRAEQRTAAIQMYSLYEDLKNAGFTAEEALNLLIGMVRGSGKKEDKNELS